MKLFPELSLQWSWVLLIVAGLFEVAWALGLKYTNGFSNLLPTLYVILTSSISVLLLAQAVKHLPVGTAYAVWTGIGALGTAIGGIILFNESADVWRLLCILLIVAGIIGLKVLSY